MALDRAQLEADDVLAVLTDDDRRALALRYDDRAAVVAGLDRGIVPGKRADSRKVEHERQQSNRSDSEARGEGRTQTEAAELATGSASALEQLSLQPGDEVDVRPRP